MSRYYGSKSIDQQSCKTMGEYNIQMSATDYKKLHETFMQSHDGSTPLDTFLYIFFTVQCVILTAIKCQKAGLPQYVQEYLLILLPLILLQTILSKHIYLANTVVSILLLFRILRSYPILQLSKVLSQKNVFKSRSATITCFRGMTYITTVFCILAVDFRSFPRYLAKTESYGISVMDQGVGLFVIMTGLVHKDLRTNSLSHIFKSNAKFIFVLFTLGIGRAVMVKELDYQEHVTEYGIHWNFFFTLAICKIVSTVVLYYSDRPLLMSILVLTVHEALHDLGLRDWVLSDLPRTNFLDGNREGLSSCLGYVSLYLFAVFVKNVLHDTALTRYQVLLKFLSISTLLYLVLSVSAIFTSVSRVLANCAYCYYLVMIFLFAFSILYLFEVLFMDPQGKVVFTVPLIVSAVNNNGLIYFLIANILTGVINMSIRTLFVTDLASVIILNLYMLFTSGSVVMLEKLFASSRFNYRNLI